MTAATSWPWNRTLSVARTACVSPDSVGIQASPCWSMSSPVTTASTPSISIAAEESIELMRACATGDRRIAMWSIPGRVRSSR